MVEQVHGLHNRSLGIVKVEVELHHRCLNSDAKVSQIGEARDGISPHESQGGGIHDGASPWKSQGW